MARDPPRRRPTDIGKFRELEQETRELRGDQLGLALQPFDTFESLAS